MWKRTSKLSAALLLQGGLLGCAETPPRVHFSDARSPPPVRSDDTDSDPYLDGTLDRSVDEGTLGRATLGEPGWLGVELAPPRDSQSGAQVVGVVRRSPAAGAGLVVGDIIVRLDNTAVSEPVSLIRRIRASNPGQRVSLGIKRAEQLRELSVPLESAPSPDELLERRFVGASAPSIDSVVVVSGDLDARWAALRGQLVLLEFWSPWCVVCQVMHQRLNEWQSQWAMHGVQVIGIAAIEPDAARAYATRFAMGYAVASDETEATFRSYDVSAVPSLFLVDRRGTIVDASTGYSSTRLAMLEKKLISLLEQGTHP
jgi:thiol-disulfide isomerase/thioredoxin